MKKGHSAREYYHIGILSVYQADMLLEETDAKEPWQLGAPKRQGLNNWTEYCHLQSYFRIVLVFQRRAYSKLRKNCRS
jgi:hypothetical protein